MELNYWQLGMYIIVKNIFILLQQKESGHTGPGIPYGAKWKDSNQANIVKSIEQPERVSTYFWKSNIINMHNQ